MQRTRDNAIAMYDITIPEHMIERSQLAEQLQEVAKKWVFQLEQGEEKDYRHFQVRLSFHKRERFSELKRNGFPLPGHWTPTSNPTHMKGDYFYAMKEQTRIDGPWKDCDPLPKKTTTQMSMFDKWELRPYQQAIKDTIGIFDLRKINLIWDVEGNCGKSLLSEHLEYLDLAEEVPPFRLMDDIFQWVASRPVRKAYIVDMPRAMKKDRLGDFYSGIEVIKNGVAYDKRYKGTKKRFDRPRVFVFTNVLPAFKLMSLDKWVIWAITKNFGYKILTPGQATLYNKGLLSLDAIPDPAPIGARTSAS
ncbi:hypothetical protein ES703_84211 [subsurface metagenome]